MTNEPAGIRCARCDKLAPITADELTGSENPDGPDLHLPVVTATPDGWFDELAESVPRDGRTSLADDDEDVSERELTGRIVCGDCATDEERTAQALRDAEAERALREVAREDGMPDEEPPDPDDDDDDDDGPVAA